MSLIKTSELKGIELVLLKKIKDLTTVRTKVTTIPSDYNDTNVKSVVAIQFVKKEYEEPSNKGRMPSFRQEVTYSFRIRVIFRELRTHQQVYPLVEEIESAVNNSDCLKEVNRTFSSIWITSTEFVEREDDSCWILDILIDFSGVITSCRHD